MDYEYKYYTFTNTIFSKAITVHLLYHNIMHIYIYNLVRL